MKYKYTVITKTICGETLMTHHYETKHDAMTEVAYHISNGYQVLVMAYSVYVNEVKSNEN